MREMRDRTSYIHVLYRDDRGAALQESSSLPLHHTETISNCKGRSDIFQTELPRHIDIAHRISFNHVLSSSLLAPSGVLVLPSLPLLRCPMSKLGLRSCALHPPPICSDAFTVFSPATWKSRYRGVSKCTAPKATSRRMLAHPTNNNPFPYLFLLAVWGAVCLYHYVFSLYPHSHPLLNIYAKRKLHCKYSLQMDHAARNAQ